MASYSFNEWANTRRHVYNLPTVVDESSVCDEGIVYNGPNGRVLGYIEEVGPEFYMLTVSNETWSEYGKEGLNTLEHLLWEHHVHPKLHHTN